MGGRGSTDTDTEVATDKEGGTRGGKGGETHREVEILEGERET